ncbi:hypothetical protein N658DRAFT_234414 [Parathielavia hyrcaniae]|uniref:Uncharacterized protein n=1 Tax=Parathielavia hyrcaniae TaxID=113614 RepID=A0AAN6QAX5_9PEZI|nr:hypothetical protein N658DRAFT_234414 [Parathielavia hyrcaniae]
MAWSLYLIPPVLVFLRNLLLQPPGIHTHVSPILSITSITTLVLRVKHQDSRFRFISNGHFSTIERQQHGESQHCNSIIISLSLSVSQTRHLCEHGMVGVAQYHEEHLLLYSFFFFFLVWAGFGCLCLWFAAYG